MRHKKITIPDLTFHSDYFYCPNCGWKDPQRRLVLGDIAHTPCENCGHSYLLRIK